MCKIAKHIPTDGVGHSMKVSTRPLLRDARFKVFRERQQRRIEYAEYKARSAEKQLADAESKVDRLRAQRKAILDSKQKMVDADRAVVNAAITWFLTAPLAANLAGMWLMISQQSLNLSTVKWATIWFVAGTITSFTSGAFRLGVSYWNWGVSSARILTYISERGNPDITVSAKPLESAFWFLSVIVATLLPIAFFLAGAGVVIAERLAGPA